MDYITLLNDDEKKDLCILISGKYFKEEFIKHPDFFNKIKKGFRAQKLSEDDVLKTVISNIDKPFIETIINELIDKYLKLIEKDVERMLSENNKTKIPEEDLALVVSLLQSPFENNIELYLKLSEKFDEEHCQSLCKIADDMRARDEKNKKFENLEEDNRILNDEINKIKSKYEQKEQEIDTLKASLSELKNENEKLKAESAAASNTVDVLSKYDDTNTGLLPADDDDKIFSLFEFDPDQAMPMLVRHADLSHDGKYHIFQKDDDLPPYFKNRKRIYYKKGPAIEGFHGIWGWSTEPNQSDTSKDYVNYSDYIQCLDAIEVYTITEAADLDGLVSILKKGITYQPHSNKVIFAFAAKGQYTGVLVKTDNLATVDEKKKTFNDDCIEVPVYKFTNNDIMQLSNGLTFYNKAFVGVPSKIYQLKSNLEIVKDIVVNSLSWPVHKERGVSRSDYTSFRDMLSSIPDDNTIAKIEEKCHCSNDAANKLLDEFKSVALQYINGETIEDTILRSVISVSPEIQEKTKKLLREDWEKENQNQLEELRKENEEEQKILDKARQEEKRLISSIADKKNLAKEVEAKVHEKIQKAREKAADFIAEMVFAQPAQIAQAAQPVQAVIAEPTATTEAPAEVSPRPAAASPYQVFPASGDLRQGKVHYTWSDALHTAAAELQNAGVAEKYAKGLSAFLCASYIEKQPVLLAGPNAIEITQAFSAAVAGHKYGRLCCDGSYSSQVIEGIGADDEKIVLINNLISSGWLNRTPEILSQKDIFYIITHPYAEDIQVEPKSLYGFMLPLFTELFVDKKASGSYSGGYFADNFNYAVPDTAHNESEGIAQLEATPLVRNRISRLIDTMHNIYSETTADDEFMFALFPIAYATLNISRITELGKTVQISENLNNDLQSLISPLQ